MNEQTVSPMKALFGIDIMVDNRIGKSSLKPHRTRRNTLVCNQETYDMVKAAITMANGDRAALVRMADYYGPFLEPRPRNFVMGVAA